jgi:hypothetical protein
MMCNPLSPQADAFSPVADRAATAASSRLPAWLVRLTALVIRFILECRLAAHARRHGLPAQRIRRPDRPSGSVQPCAASIGGEFSDAIARACLRHGIASRHPGRPALSCAIAAFGGWLRGLRLRLPADGLRWHEDPDIVPGMIGQDRTRPAADTTSLLLLRSRGASSGARFASRACRVRPSLAPSSASARSCPCRARSSNRAASCLRLSTPSCLEARCQSMAGAPVLIRTGRKLRC